MIQKLAILGATGSIGTSALAVVRHHRDKLAVVALAAQGRHPAKLLELAREFRPRLVAVLEPEAAESLRGELPAGVELAVGEAGLAAAACHEEVDKVVAAMVGAAGLLPVAAALAAGKNVALANKESLVVAGRLLTASATRSGAVILPIDSEHAALHQALRCGAPHEVRRLVLTASGGPFLRRDPATFAAIRPEEALKHPTWAMGAKISIDSATLMNKGLELIEATHLFAVPSAAIDVVVHPQSILHSLVEYRDGSCLAQLSVNDMIFPIQYALAWPERWENDFPRLQLEKLGALELEPLDEVRFPSVGLARRALALGDSGPAVYNAANEVAVHAFLDGGARFSEIVATVAAVLDEHAARPAPSVGSIDEALEWDRWGRERALLALRGHDFKH